MSGERFTLDTNLLIYSVHATAGLRHRVAADVVERAVLGDCRLTLQAVSEFFAAVTRKGLVPAPDAAAQSRDWLLLFPSLSASATAVQAALGSAEAGRASYRDSLLVATAAEGGCRGIAKSPAPMWGGAAAARRWPSGHPDPGSQAPGEGVADAELARLGVPPSARGPETRSEWRVAGHRGWQGSDFAMALRAAAGTSCQRTWQTAPPSLGCASSTPSERPG